MVLPTRLSTTCPLRLVDGPLGYLARDVHAMGDVAGEVARITTSRPVGK